MALPPLIQLDPLPLPHPLPLPVVSVLTIPGSKSITNRALILAALADGTVRLEGALWSEDTQVMVECLHRLGFNVRVAPEEQEPANRTLEIRGLGGRIPNGGTENQPLDLFVGNAGTAARFLTAFTCLGHGVYRLHGVPRMEERPQATLLGALRQLGYRIDAPGDRFPVIVHGAGPRPGKCEIPLSGSSQFASALLLSARIGHWTVNVVGTDEEEEAPYVAMTEALIRSFPNAGGTFVVEPDASSASYFWAADWLLRSKFSGGKAPTDPIDSTPSIVQIRNRPKSGWQVDARFPECLPLPGVLSRQLDLGDSILTAMILAPFSKEPTRFIDLGRLRVQECERVHAMRTELNKCGVRVDEIEDSLTIHPGPVHGAEIETYNDHRIAMCFAILGLVVPDIRLRNPSCVRKTFPNFFSKLAALPPQGLGVTLRALPENRILSELEWLAE